MEKWNSNSIYIFRFSFSHDSEKQLWILLFVFHFRLTLKNGFEVRFSFSRNFEERKWFSFFVFVWFVIEKQISISFVVFAWLDKRITALVIWSPRTPPKGWPGHSLFMQVKCKWIFLSPGPKWMVWLMGSRPHDMSHTHGTPFFNKGWQIIWWLIAAKKTVDFGAAIATIAYPRWRRKMTNIWTLQLEVTKCEITKNLQIKFYLLLGFCRMTQSLQVSFLSSFPRYNYILSY